MIRRDRGPKFYVELILSGFRAMKPMPKIAITRFGTGVHSFWKADPELPFGIAPSAIKSWKEAVTDGYFAQRVQDVQIVQAVLPSGPRFERLERFEPLAGVAS